ncbi:MAG: uroporphyrinogen decarboxylase family protein, partial [Planctomycetota bacterium]
FPTFEEVEPDSLVYVEPWDVSDITYPFSWGFDPEPLPRDDFFPDYHFDGLRRTVSEARGEFSVHGEIFSPFSQFLELLNYEAALMALLDDPEKTHACLSALTTGTIELGSKQASCGADAILISSAFAGGGLISREHYEEFVLPYERQVIEGIRQRHPDTFVYTHTCGSIGDRLDLMLETGTQGIDTLDPPPLGTVELGDAKTALHGRAFIKGNLDPVNTLLRGTVDDVKQAAAQRLRIGAERGGYILSTACSVAPAAPPENLEALSEVADDLGRYA